ncbi:TAFII28-domain-containing protein [Amylocystis lapponica]|nr:TAFII28-domain-containing protein [Amylocystis lapponica]
MDRSFVTSGAPSTPLARGGAPTRGTGAKRGRKPKNAASATSSPRPPSQPPLPGPSQPTELQWQNVAAGANRSFTAPGSTSQAALSSETGGVISLPGVVPPVGIPAADAATAASGRQSTAVPGAPGVEEDVEGEDEMLPAMADADYSAQLSWQSQSKDNLKVLMDNFSPAQYDRFEAYRRHALPKAAVRKVIQQTLGQQASQPVAQVVAGFAKVFVGEIIEKARAVQERRGEHGPLAPDHLREAYRLYQQETGRVGAARPLRSKRLFVR